MQFPCQLHIERLYVGALALTTAGKANVAGNLQIYFGTL